MFFDAAGQFGYVEPVATDPRYRRLGLGRAAVLCVVGKRPSVRSETSSSPALGHL
jgi:hypothetical protein